MRWREVGAVEGGGCGGWRVGAVEEGGCSKEHNNSKRRCDDGNWEQIRRQTQRREVDHAAKRQMSGQV
jgi:hypothetical protein